ncbi:MAG: MotA/TolQ/ExbB proton channel family protein [Planctomycetota bacterium]
MSTLLAQSSGLGALTGYIANAIYFVLAGVALWGAFCVIMVWTRVAQKRFRNEEEQDALLDQIEPMIQAGDFDSVETQLDGDLRAVPQLALLAVRNRDMGYSNVRHLVMDRFQRDVLADLEHRLSWVNTVIKSAPMIGLLGTVMGMMGAFAKLAGAENVRPDALAADIMVALITTAAGLSIAIPLVLCTASINIRISKMEDLVAAGLTRFFSVFKRTSES